MADFPGVKDATLKTELERYADGQRVRQPMAKFEIVLANFTVANQDLDIPHSLAPDDPESVHYILIGATAATSLYQDMTGTRKPWQKTHILLRSSAIARAIILLFITDERQKVTFF